MSEPVFVDALGVRHAPVATARIASLVPSITELLFELKLDHQLVARTRYCIHPAERVGAVPCVGGTKKIKHQALQALAPTHALLNIDENSEAMAARLADYVPHLIVTHPVKPEDNLALYRLLGGIFQRARAADSLCRHFTQTRDQVYRQSWPTRRVLYLIWRKPWMTVARATYVSRMLALVGQETFPAVSTPRYPTLTLDPDLLATVDYVLFSTEPYPFTPADLATFARQYDCPPAKLLLIDGEMTSWYGSRAIAGLDYLQRFARTRM